MRGTFKVHNRLLRSQFPILGWHWAFVGIFWSWPGLVNATFFQKPEIEGQLSPSVSKSAFNHTMMIQTHQSSQGSRASPWLSSDNPPPVIKLASETPEPNVVSPTPQDQAVYSEAQQIAFNLQNSFTGISCPAAGASTLTKLKPLIESCAKAINSSAHVCLESFSPKIKEILPYVTMLANVFKQVQDMQKACHKAIDLYSFINGGLAIYHTVCGIQQRECAKHCLNLKTRLSASGRACPQLEAELVPISQLAVNHCNGYAKHAAAAITGISTTLIQMLTAQKCEKDVVAASPVPTPNCSDPILANTPQCRGNGNNPTPPSPQFPSPRAPPVVTPPPIGDSGNLTLPDAMGLMPADEPASSGLAHAPRPGEGMFPGGAGSVGAPLGASGGSGAPGANPATDRNASPASKEFQPKVMESSTSSGYGGSSSRGSAGSSPYPGKWSSIAQKMDEAFKKDRSPASSGGITGALGLSNWEKVNMRYRAQQKTLLSGK